VEGESGPREEEARPLGPEAKGKVFSFSIFFSNSISNMNQLKFEYGFKYTFQFKSK